MLELEPVQAWLLYAPHWVIDIYINNFEGEDGVRWKVPTWSKILFPLLIFSLFTVLSGKNIRIVLYIVSYSIVPCNLEKFAGAWSFAAKAYPYLTWMSGVRDYEPCGMITNSRTRSWRMAQHWFNLDMCTNLKTFLNILEARPEGDNLFSILIN